MTITWQEGRRLPLCSRRRATLHGASCGSFDGRACPLAAVARIASAERPRRFLVTLDSPKMTIPDDPGRRGVVGVVVRDGRMLVIRRSRSVVAPLVYCFPGGGIESGESEEESLVREFREEIGVAIRPVRRLWQCVTAWKVELAWWLVEMAPDAMPVANPSEVESIHWFTPEEMARLAGLAGEQPGVFGVAAAGDDQSAVMGKILMLKSRQTLIIRSERL